MDQSTAMQVMGALSQATRLSVFARLVAVLPLGMASGELAVAANAAPNTMSAHLAVLSRAGLVTSSRDGRVVTYRAATEPVAQLRAFLAATCGDRAPDPSP